MTDSAQDYTYEVLSIDSFGEAMIQVTSYDSLQSLLWYQIDGGDSDGTISDFVAKQFPSLLPRWAALRDSGSGITIGTPVAGRYKVQNIGTKPVVNELTTIAVASDSENNDEIVTTYTTRALSDSEKGEVYTRLTVTREELWQKLRTGGFIDTVLNGLGIRQPIHASWDATAAGSYNWSTDKIASLNVDSVSRIAEGKFRVHFTNEMDDSNYSVVSTVGSTDYSGFGASPRTLSVLDRTPTHVDVICERTDDAANEDNFFNSVAISTNKDAEEDSDYVALYNQSNFKFRDGLAQTIKSLMGKNDSDFADFLVNQ